VVLELSTTRTPRHPVARLTNLSLASFLFFPFPSTTFKPDYATRFYSPAPDHRVFGLARMSLREKTFPRHISNNRITRRVRPDRRNPIPRAWNDTFCDAYRVYIGTCANVSRIEDDTIDPFDEEHAYGKFYFRVYSYLYRPGEVR
jgi:hypothetical protein